MATLIKIALTATVATAATIAATGLFVLWWTNEEFGHSTHPWNPWEGED